MSRYIELDSVIDRIEQEWGYEGIREDLEQLPTADVAPVDHAHWLDTPQGYLKCSNCGSEFLMMRPYNYCPDCGAKMDETAE